MPRVLDWQWVSVYVYVTSKYQAGLAGGRLSEPGVHICVCVCVCVSERESAGEVGYWRNQDVQASYWRHMRSGVS